MLATGGFPVRLAREHGLLVRSNPWSEGDGLDFACARGAELAGEMDEFYGRAMPAPPARIDESDYVRLSQLWGGEARVVDEDGEEFFPGPPAWHESDLAQAIARRPGGTAWFCVSDEQRDDPRVTGLREAGGTIVEEYGELCLHVAAAVTHTQGGLRIDENARVAGTEGIFAAGVDVGGVATGGYASGLAQALVLGLVCRGVCASGERLQIDAAARVSRKRRGRHLRHAQAGLVLVDLCAELGRVALALAQLVAVRGPDEAQVCALLRLTVLHRGRDASASAGPCRPPG